MNQPILTSVIVVHLVMLNVVFAVLFRPFMPKRIGMMEMPQSSMSAVTVNTLFYGLLAIISGIAILLYGYAVFISGPQVILLFMGAVGTCFLVYWARFHRLNPSKNDKLGFIQTYIFLLIFMLPLGILTCRFIVS